MLDKLKFVKYILIIILIFYYIAKYFDYEYDNVPISKIEESLTNNPRLYESIYIDEINKVAYMKLNSTYNNVMYKTSFSDHDNFRQMIKNLTEDYYENIIISYSNRNTIGELLYDILICIIIINIIHYVLKMLIPDSQNKTIDDSSELFSFLPSSSTKFYTIIKNTNIKFTDVIGLKTVKDDLQEFVKYLQFNDIYKSNGCEISRGLLFVGPPGVGKTLIAKAFASESGATFIYTTGSSFNELFVGMGSKRIRQLFEYARKQVPCIIFIDEIDAIGSRDISLDRGEYNRTINALLAEMDGMVDSSGLMVIAATNLIESLDPALTRSGRFDKKIVFDLPTYNERIELFKSYLSKIKLDTSFNNEEDIKLLAQRTARLTGADIKNICNQGILNHMKRYVVKESFENKKKVLSLENPSSTTGCTMKDLNEALDDIGIGNKKTEKAMTDKEKKQVAYHESGHTLISCLIEGGNIPLKVSIIPRGHSLGFTQPDVTDKCLLFKKEFLANICITLGGRAAEKIIFDDITTGASDDLKKVSDLVKKYFIDHSFGNKMYITIDKLHSDIYKSNLNNSMQELINICFELVLKILSDNKNILHNIAKELLEKETLNKSDLVEIIPEEKIGSYRITI